MKAFIILSLLLAMISLYSSIEATSNSGIVISLTALIISASAIGSSIANDIDKK